MNRSLNKPRCVICVNVGKDANHYTKHNGVVVCPVIKNNVCRNCGKKGHFQDHCTKQAPTVVRAILKRPVSEPKHETSRFYFSEEEEEDQSPAPPKPQIKVAPWAVGKVLQQRSKWAYMSDDEED
jgi:hypothetical protein